MILFIWYITQPRERVDWSSQSFEYRLFLYPLTTISNEETFISWVSSNSEAKASDITRYCLEILRRSFLSQRITHPCVVEYICMYSTEELCVQVRMLQNDVKILKKCFRILNRGLGAYDCVEFVITIPRL